MDRRNFLHVSIASLVSGNLLRDGSFYAQEPKSEISRIFFNEQLWLSLHVILDFKDGVKKILPVDNAVLLGDENKDPSALMLGTGYIAKRRERLSQVSFMTRSGNLVYNSSTSIDLWPDDLFLLSYTLIHGPKVLTKIIKSMPEDNWLERKFISRTQSDCNLIDRRRFEKRINYYSPCS